MAQASKGIQLTIGGISIATFATVVTIAIQIGMFIGSQKELSRENKEAHVRIEESVGSQKKEIIGMHRRIGAISGAVQAHTGKPISGE